MSRIPRREAAFDPETPVALERMMPGGVPPIALFRTFAHNLAMTDAMQGWGSYELSKALSLSLQDREIVIDGTCARCGCEYEWGVHVAFFAARAALDDGQIESLTRGGADDPCWTSERDQLLVRTVDAAHDTADIPNDLWDDLVTQFGVDQIIDLTMLCGWYRAISFTAVATPGPARGLCSAIHDFPTRTREGRHPMAPLTTTVVRNSVESATLLSASDVVNSTPGAAPFPPHGENHSRSRANSRSTVDDYFGVDEPDVDPS